MKTEVEYVVEGQHKGKSLELVRFADILLCRQTISAYMAHDEKAKETWSYRILKRTKTITDEVIE